MSDDQEFDEKAHVGRTPYWTLLGIIAVGLTVMIVVPLAGR